MKELVTIDNSRSKEDVIKDFEEEYGKIKM